MSNQELDRIFFRLHVRVSSVMSKYLQAKTRSHIGKLLLTVVGVSFITFCYLHLMLVIGYANGTVESDVSEMLMKTRRSGVFRIKVLHDDALTLESLRYAVGGNLLEQCSLHHESSRAEYGSLLDIYQNHCDHIPLHEWVVGDVCSYRVNPPLNEVIGYYASSYALHNAVSIDLQTVVEVLKDESHYKETLKMLRTLSLYLGNSNDVSFELRTRLYSRPLSKDGISDAYQWLMDHISKIGQRSVSNVTISGQLSVDADGAVYSSSGIPLYSTDSIYDNSTLPPYCSHFYHFEALIDKSISFLTWDREILSVQFPSGISMESKDLIYSVPCFGTTLSSCSLRRPASQLTHLNMNLSSVGLHPSQSSKLLLPLSSLPFRLSRGLRTSRDIVFVADKELIPLAYPRRYNYALFQYSPLNEERSIVSESTHPLNSHFDGPASSVISSMKSLHQLPETLTLVCPYENYPILQSLMSFFPVTIRVAIHSAFREVISLRGYLLFSPKNPYNVVKSISYFHQGDSGRNVYFGSFHYLIESIRALLFGSTPSNSSLNHVSVASRYFSNRQDKTTTQMTFYSMPVPEAEDVNRAKEVYTRRMPWGRFFILRLGIFFSSLFVVFSGSSIVAFTLMQTQAKMARFTVAMQIHIQNQEPVSPLVWAHFRDSLLFVPIQLGLYLFLYHINSDRILAFMLLLVYWMAELWSVTAARTLTSIITFPAIFVFLMTFMHAHTLSYPFGLHYLGFTVAFSVLLVCVFMLWNEHELPALHMRVVSRNQLRVASVLSVVDYIMSQRNDAVSYSFLPQNRQSEHRFSSNYHFSYNSNESHSSPQRHYGSVSNGNLDSSADYRSSINGPASNINPNNRGSRVTGTFSNHNSPRRLNSHHFNDLTDGPSGMLGAFQPNVSVTEASECDHESEIAPNEVGQTPASSYLRPLSVLVAPTSQSNFSTQGTPHLSAPTITYLNDATSIGNSNPPTLVRNESSEWQWTDEFDGGDSCSGTGDSSTPYNPLSIGLSASSSTTDFTGTSVN